MGLQEICQQLQCRRQFESEVDFVNHAMQRCHEFEANGPLCPFPAKSVCRTIRWKRYGERSLYLAVYDMTAFEDLFDFQLFCKFASTAHQEIYQRDAIEQVDVSWFVPDPRERFVPPLVTTWWSGSIAPAVRNGKGCRKFVTELQQCVPRSFELLSGLNLRCGIEHRIESGELEFIGRTNDQYVHVMILDDGFNFDSEDSFEADSLEVDSDSRLIVHRTGDRIFGGVDYLAAFGTWKGGMRKPPGRCKDFRYRLTESDRHFQVVLQGTGNWDETSPVEAKALWESSPFSIPKSKCDDDMNVAMDFISSILIRFYSEHPRSRYFSSRRIAVVSPMAVRIWGTDKNRFILMQGDTPEQLTDHGDPTQP
ncbi:MAG: hypothetical protein R3C20_17770 [Planctomycetaceae bacterium]